MSINNSTYNSPAFLKLKERYLINLNEKIILLDDYFINKNTDIIAEYFHKFKGNGLTYGFKEITEIGAIIDLHYKSRSPDFLDWAKVALSILKKILPLLQNNLPVDLENLPEFKHLSGSTTHLKQRKPMDSLSELNSFLKPTQVRTDLESLKVYGKDWTTYFDINAQAVLFPESISDVQNIVIWANKNKVSLVPSGGRTGLSGAAVARDGEVVVSFEKMNKIKELNSIDRHVVCEPGVVVEELQRFAIENNLYYPVDFAARGSSQIGGTIATNAGGIKVLRYGMTRDWIVGLKVITGTGALLDLNKGLVKNATGYDLRHLFIGSEGTLGFIVEATVKLASQPPPLKTLLLACSSLSHIMDVFSLFKEKCILTAFEMFSDKALNYVLDSTQLSSPFDDNSPFYIVLEVECPHESVEDLILQCFEKGIQNGSIRNGLLAQSEEQARAFWKLREQISESLSRYSPYKNDLSVKISLVPSFIEDLDKVLKESYPDWNVVWFGHIGDGNLHINILKPNDLTKEVFVKECQKVDTLVFKSTQRFSGSISAEHGVGLTKKPFLHYSRSEEEIKIMKDIKSIFDPLNIINPGKILM